ncbi:MAG: DUF624 domain-containing protein [Defluviitaleaceae bacterium]|nr:DUF624 domain-containing protein [Defluviitaleaceae bacterium]MCL2238537.1 DUF624 domain-containing protein [Defluviitaleaceae bacterium]
MRDFFSLDGAFSKYGGMLADMVILSLMWILFCLPFVTAGASTTALYYVSTRRIADREGYITSDFWLAFKSNIKRATIIWMIIVLIVAVLVFNILALIDGETLQGGIFTFMLPAQLVLLFVIALMSVYIYPLIARFDMGLIQVLKSAFYMAVRHFLTTITCLILLVASLFILWNFPPMLVVAPGLYAWLVSHMIMRIFKKYRPEMDRDPMLEIAEIEARKAEERRRQELGLDSKEEEEEE